MTNHPTQILIDQNAVNDYWLGIADIQYEETIDNPQPLTPHESRMIDVLRQLLPPREELRRGSVSRETSE